MKRTGLRSLTFLISALLLAVSIIPAPSRISAANSVVDLSTTNSSDLVIIGARPDDLAGTSVAVGDLNADNIDDLVIGVPGSDGPGGQRFDCGEVLVFFGKTGFSGTIDLSSVTPDLRFSGPQLNDFLGSNVAFIDVNRDQIKDLVMAAPGSNINQARTDAGALYVVLGGRSSPQSRDFATTQPDVFIIGPRINSFIGTSLAGGDFNGDGGEDLVIGAADAPATIGGPARGAAFIFFTFNITTPFTLDLGNIDQVSVTILGANTGDKFGASVATADLNRDGRRDLIVGAPNSSNGSRALSGSVNVFYGPFSTGTVIDLSRTSPGFQLFGPAANSRLGEAVFIGDVDADRIDDLVATAPGNTFNGRASAGQTFILYGSAPLLGSRDLAATPADASVGGVNAGDQLGSGQSLLITDIDKDNFSDLMISGLNSTNPADRARNGQIYILLKGGDRFEQRDLQTKPADITILGARSLDQIGVRMAVGDINNDGRRDLIVGAPNSSGPAGSRSRAGVVYSISNFNQGSTGNNQPPTIVPIPSQTVGETGSISVDVAAVDPDGRVTLSLINPPTPSFVTLTDFGNGSGRINISPPANSRGTYTVRVRATDNGNPPLSATIDFALTVTPPAPSIQAAVYDPSKKTITITGTRFGTAPRVIVNGTDRSGRIKSVSDTQILLKGNKGKLGLVTGDNIIQVIDSSGNPSNTVIIRV